LRADIAAVVLDMFLQDVHLRTVFAIYWLDSQHVFPPARPAGPVGTGNTVLIEVGEHIVHREQHRFGMAGYAVFTEKTFLAVLLEPLHERPGTFHAQHWTDYFFFGVAA